MDRNNKFVDIYCAQRNCDGEKICGDTFVFRRLDGGNRPIVVLSDGMGHGIKANVLSTVTATTIANFDYLKDDIAMMAKFIIKSLPVCSVRKMSYSTFSLVAIDLPKSLATIIEYDNPACMVLRNGEPLELEWKKMEFENNQNNRRTITTATFTMEDGDRIVVMSDGVTQSGIGKKSFPFGWKRANVLKFIQSYLDIFPACSSSYLAEKVVHRAVENDGYATQDDISCGVITLRDPKNLLLCSCPPAREEQNSEMIKIISNFEGRKVICGYHLAILISTLTNQQILKGSYSSDPDVQPQWYMEGVDFITESLVTLNKVYDLLQNGVSESDKKGAAYDIYRLALASDRVTILMGTSRGNGGEYMVDEYELRRKTMRYIASILEQKYMKEVNVIYN